MTSFASGFADKLKSFIQQKQALGFSYSSAEDHLVFFDRYCSRSFPDENTLTKDICLSWATKRDNETNGSFRTRISPIREFARYLIRSGEDAFIIPIGFGNRETPPDVYIFSQSEILTVWDMLDGIKPHGKYPFRHLVMPAIIRLLYCCGLRPAEGRKLKVTDVDLQSGKLFIRESKGHKDRIVMLADDMCQYLRTYNSAVQTLLREREWFFPASAEKPFSDQALLYTFRSIKEQLGWKRTDSYLPRLYDFRHSFATHRLYQWMKDGEDLMVMLPYLSAYMGHAQLSDTYYYIHLVPEQLQTMSGLDFSKYEALLPEVM